MTAFTAALDTLFADPNLGASALWRAGGAGAGVAVRVLASQPDDEINFEGKRLRVESRRFDVRIAECPALAPGDTIELNGDICAVLDVARDEDRLVWRVSLGGDPS